MRILLYEDSAASQLEPVTLTKPAFCIRCGGQRLVDALAPLAASIQLHVRPHLRATVAADFPHATASEAIPPENILCINARLVPSEHNLRRVRKLLDGPAAPVAEVADAVCVVQAHPDFDVGALAKSQIPSSGDWQMFEFPHDIVRHHLATFGDQLEALIQTFDDASWQQPSEGVFVERGAEVAEHVCYDTQHGPIVIRGGAQVGPFSFLQGPLHIEHSARILPHAQIKDATYIGQGSKVGGEVEASIIEAYSNKQHHGFLGHAYVGSWVNLGAGTSNSDLKNTYGLINVEYEGVKQPTGMQFLGCVLGDYVKTAINTSIYTGKHLGACSMLYGTVAENVSAFVNFANGKSVITPEVVVTMQKRMFARRDVTHRECDAALIRAAFELTAPQRQSLSAGPPAF